MCRIRQMVSTMDNPKVQVLIMFDVLRMCRDVGDEVHPGGWWRAAGAAGIASGAAGRLGKAAGAAGVTIELSPGSSRPAHRMDMYNCTCAGEWTCMTVRVRELPIIVTLIMWL